MAVAGGVERGPGRKGPGRSRPDRGKVTAALARGLRSAGVSLALGASAVAAGAIEVEVEAVLAPFNRPIEAAAWADFRLTGIDPAMHRLFPLESRDRLLTRFTLVTGPRSLEGRLEEVLFPATVYVGRACPPQDHAELVEVVPGRRGASRPARPAEEASRRGRWRGFSAEGADTLTARYFCFAAAHRMEDGDFPPDPREEPPPAEPEAAEQAPGTEP